MPVTPLLPSAALPLRMTATCEALARLVHWYTQLVIG
jgi:hypothetical protein